MQTAIDEAGFCLAARHALALTDLYQYTLNLLFETYPQVYTARSLFARCSQAHAEYSQHRPSEEGPRRYRHLLQQMVDDDKILSTFALQHELPLWTGYTLTVAQWLKMARQQQLSCEV